MKHTISVLVENKFGVLARIAGLFSARGFNIESLAVGETEDPSVSRMTIVTEGDERTLDQIKKQLIKLIDVIKVSDFTGREYVERELMLIKAAVTAKNREELIEAVSSMGAQVVNAGERSLSIEMTGDSKKVNALIELLRPFGILEVVRTGRVAMGIDDKEMKAKGKPEVNE